MTTPTLRRIGLDAESIATTRRVLDAALAGA
jgi:hypothetical protein